MEKVRRALLELLNLLLPQRREAALIAATSDAEALSKFSFGTVVDGIHVLSSYKDPLVCALIRELKYRRDRRSAEILGSALAEALLSFVEDEGVLERPLVLIPSPLSQERLRARGFNQVELVLAVAARRLGEARVAGLLKKMRDTAPQTSLSRQGRLQNVEGTFALTGALPEGLLIVVDDVMTTGATLSEAKRALRLPGAREVVLIALAH